MRFQIYISTVLLIATLSNCNQVPKQTNDDLTSNLIIYEELNGDFSFLSISNPQIDKIEQKTYDGQPHIMYIYSYDYSGYSFCISYYPILYNSSNIKNDNEILFDNMVSGAALQPNLLEADTDLRFIQSLLGHSSIKTTTIYTHLTKKSVDRIQSPLVRLVDEARKKENDKNITK